MWKGIRSSFKPALAYGHHHGGRNNKLAPICVNCGPSLIKMDLLKRHEIMHNAASFRNTTYLEHNSFKLASTIIIFQVRFHVVHSKIYFYTLYTHAFLLCGVWLFSTVRFQMSPQIYCLRGGIVTLVAFVWPFSTVRFQMTPQSACLRRGIVTLVAFVWLFPTVRFQMCPQMNCLRRGKVALVALV